MATTPEAKVKAKVRKVLDEYGAYYFSPPANGFGRAGIPDIIACYKGKFIGIECKAGTNTPTALQLREIERINEAEGYALVVNEHSIQQLQQLMGQINE